MSNGENLETVGLTVDELIAALQKVSQDGHGAAPAHALMGGHTGPVRGVETVPGWGAAGEIYALVIADD